MYFVTALLPPMLQRGGLNNVADALLVELPSLEVFHSQNNAYVVCIWYGYGTMELPDIGL